MNSVPLLCFAWATVFPFPPAADRFGDPLPAGAVARLGFVRTGTGSPLNIADGPLAAFAPDGRLFATACHNRVYVWDVTTGRVRWRFTVGDTHVGRLVFTADGRELIVQTGPGRVRRWRLDTGREVPDEVIGKALWGRVWLSPGGRWLVSPDGDVWDRAAGEKVGGGRKLPVGNAQVSLAFPADEDRVFVAGVERAGDKDKHTLELWDVAAGKWQRSFDGFRGTAIACSPDGRTVAATVSIPDPKVVNKGTYTVTLYDTEAGRERLRLPERKTYFERPVFSPDGKRFAAVVAWEGVGVWDAATGKELGWWPYTRDYPGWLAFAPDGRTVGVCGQNGTATLWDVATGRPRSLSGEFPYRVTDLLFSDDGKELVAGYSDGTVRLWDLATQEMKHTSRPGHSPAQSAVTDLTWTGSPGVLIYRSLGKPAGETRRLDLTTGRDEPLSLVDGVDVQAVSAATRTLVVGPPPPTLQNMAWQSLAPEKLEAARRAAAARPELRGFRVIAPAPEAASPRLGLGGFADRRVASHVVAVSPDGTHVVESMMTLPGNGFMTGMGPIWTHTGSRLVDAGTGRVVRDFPWPHARMAFTPDARSLVLWMASGRANTVERIEAYTGQARWRATLGKPVGTLAVSPDGQWLAVTEAEGDRLRLLDTTTGTAAAEYRTGRLYYRSDRPTFSPDGRRVALAEGDGTVLVCRVPAAPARPAGKPTTKELADAWRELASADAAVAFRALVRLADAPTAAVPLLRRELLREDDKDRIERLIAGLDAAAFADRERATRELADLGAVARPFLARALRPGVSPEARTRLEKLLAAQADPFATPAGLRQLRAVEALERIGTVDARRVLERLADGSPDDDPLGREARATVERMRR